MLIDVLQGKTHPVPIDNTQSGSYYTFPTREERIEFKRRVAERNSRHRATNA